MEERDNKLHDDGFWLDPEVRAIVRVHMGKVIKTLRGNRPQHAVAREVGVSGATWTDWEKHRCPPEKHWEKIAGALGHTKVEMMERAWECNWLSEAKASTIQDLGRKLDHLLSKLEVLSDRVHRIDHRLYRRHRRNAGSQGA